jgi:hypothetical protein
MEWWGMTSVIYLVLAFIDAGLAGWNVSLGNYGVALFCALAFFIQMAFFLKEDH